VKEFYIKLAVSALVVGGAFAFAWKQGLIARLGGYLGETREELRKCNWPSRDELMNSTLLIFVVIAGLGLFTVGSDFVLLKLVRYLLGA
jgi:preprotein translocase SecE subunit